VTESVEVTVTTAALKALATAKATECRVGPTEIRIDAASQRILRDFLRALAAETTVTGCAPWEPGKIAESQ
jgi:hypothetical protein